MAAFRNMAAMRHWFSLSNVPIRKSLTEVSKSGIRCVSFSFSDDMMHKVSDYASRDQTGVSLHTLLEFGSGATESDLLLAARFLHHELPIRLARRVKELDTLPFGLGEMKSVRVVRNWYLQSFKELLDHNKPQSQEDEQSLSHLLGSIYERHSGTLLMMARGVYEFKIHMQKQSHDGGRVDLSDPEFADIQRFLDNFYMSRIGIRMLIGQHLELRKNIPGYVGLICRQTNPGIVAQDAIDNARYTCARQYGDAPEVTLHGRMDLHFPYVPSHLHHMLFELLKNSMRAVCEFHGVDSAMPPIRVIIADDEKNEDVAIKVSDEGGGIPRSQLAKIWSYFFTTAQETALANMLNVESSDGVFTGFERMDSPLAGLGYGLPYSRLFARYFGGEIQVISMEGYGTDAYLHLNRLGDTEEPLP